MRRALSGRQEEHGMEFSYAYGGINMHWWWFEGAPKWPFTYMESVYDGPERSFAPRLLFTGIGGSFMALLFFCASALSGGQNIPGEKRSFQIVHIPTLDWNMPTDSGASRI